jgi:hypothetical protein
VRGWLGWLFVSDVYILFDTLVLRGIFFFGGYFSLLRDALLDGLFPSNDTSFGILQMWAKVGPFCFFTFLFMPSKLPITNALFGHK